MDDTYHNTREYTNLNIPIFTGVLNMVILNLFILTKINNETLAMIWSIQVINT